MYVHHSWAAMFCAPLWGWLAASNYWHDALHFALSTKWQVNTLAPYLFPFFMSPFMWLHQHTIGHHVHTNDPLRDPDINAAPQFLRLSAFQRIYPVHAKQKSRLWTFFLWSIATSTLKPLLRDHMSRIEGWYGSCVPLVFETPLRKVRHIAGRFTVLCLMSVWPYLCIIDGSLYSMFKAHCFAWIPAMTFSVLFVMNAQINHLNEENEHESSNSEDFFIHQAQTSSSYATDSKLAFVLSGGLNLQIEHHLLPGINHWHLFYMSDSIRAVCLKHGVVYTKWNNFGEALEAHLQYSENLAVAATAPFQTNKRMEKYIFAKDTRLSTKLKNRNRSKRE
jgi:fatty acid desaturase